MPCVSPGKFLGLNEKPPKQLYKSKARGGGQGESAGAQLGGTPLGQQAGSHPEGRPELLGSRSRNEDGHANKNLHMNVTATSSQEPKSGNRQVFLNG